jgi:uncharacterized membrane protein YczE
MRICENLLDGVIPKSLIISALVGAAALDARVFAGTLAACLALGWIADADRKNTFDEHDF